MTKLKIVGGFSQPIALIPDGEKTVGHPCTSKLRNPKIELEMKAILTKNQSKKLIK